MNDKYISVSKFKQSLAKLTVEGGDKKYAEAIARTLSEVVPYLLDDSPAADVQPVKHGRWSECYTDSHHYSGICTVCGKASIRSIKENPLEYCPKCGARMDGDI